MITIYKYPIRIADEQSVQMPKGAKIIRADTDLDGVPCIWAKVDTNRDPEFRLVFVHGTGHPIPSGREYVGSFKHEDRFVWHVFTKA